MAVMEASELSEANRGNVILFTDDGEKYAEVHVTVVKLLDCLLFHVNDS